jgi:predicted RNA-binding Zn-ribbon protein involved in translation (DUF1610 family)
MSTPRNKKTPFVCASCGSTKSKVANTRSRDNRVYRDRRCLNCGFGYKTCEVMLDTSADDYKLAVVANLPQLVSDVITIGQRLEQLHKDAIQ